MCVSCGCGGDGVTIQPVDSLHHHRDHEHGDHDHGDRDRHDAHQQHHHHGPAPHVPSADRADRVVLRSTVELQLEARVLAKNERAATDNRHRFQHQQLGVLNLLGSPGAGKTALLEATIASLGQHTPLYVVEGDQATDRDAQRIRAAGGNAIQIDTGQGCHLEATAIARAIDRLDPPPGALVAIENVGNLVCPALFDLGEAAKVVVISTTEGDDKPLKYPHAFRAADAVVLTKIDLMPYIPFDRDHFLDCIARINPAVPVFEVSALQGVGIEAWGRWAIAAAAAQALPSGR